MKKKFRAAAIGLITGFANGLFGAGGGTVLVPGMVFFMDIEDHKAHATAISVILPLSIVSSLIYYRHNVVDTSLALKVVMGSVAGGLVGSSLLHRIPINILRKFFGVIMIIAAVRMWL